MGTMVSDVRLIGGPLDGLTIPRVRGYFREGDTEYVDGINKETGLPIPPALYLMRGGDLHFVQETEPVDGEYGATTTEEATQ